MGLVDMLMEGPSRTTVGSLAVVIVSAASSRIWHHALACNLAGSVLAAPPAMLNQDEIPRIQPCQAAMLATLAYSLPLTM